MRKMEDGLSPNHPGFSLLLSFKSYTKKNKLYRITLMPLDLVERVLKDRPGRQRNELSLIVDLESMSRQI